MARITQADQVLLRIITKRAPGSGPGEPPDSAATRIAGSANRLVSRLSGGVPCTIPRRAATGVVFVERNERRPFQRIPYFPSTRWPIFNNFPLNRRRDGERNSRHNS